MSGWSRIFIILILICLIEHVCQDKLAKYIRKCGYPAETHKIVTEDGYILRTHRIPHGKASNRTNENVVLVVHGLASSAEGFISLGPNDALAFLLADRGFDVWLFNARGTLHGRRHKTKSPNYLQGSGFWNFSWHEISIYDVPANIDYILEKTKKPSLYYIGYSQGGTCYCVTLSEKPEYNEKIKAAALLAPGVLMQYTEYSLAKFFSKFYLLLERLANMFSYYELIIPNSSILNGVLKWFCTSSKEFMEACVDIIQFVGGQPSGLINVSLIPAIMDYTPAGFSTHQVFHYIQVIKSGYFGKYDYGNKTNLIKYNDTYPPEYNLSNCRVPVALFTSNGDTLVSKKSVYELSKILPNVETLYEVPYDNFNHLDHILAYNVKELVYEPVYDYLNQFVEN